MLDENREYWMFQLISWSTLTLLSFLSLTVWYNPGQWTPAFHTILQSGLGVIVSHPMRSVGLRAWNRPLASRLGLNAAAILIAALIWTVMRLATFIALTGEIVGPEDWGGWFFASVIVFGCWAFCFHALRYNRLLQTQHSVTLKAQSLAQQESLRRLEAENLSQQAELRMLRQQVSPHFLFNALNSVTSQIRTGKNDEAAEMLARISDFLRSSLEGDGDLHHPLIDEIGIVDLYLGIEKVRFGARLETTFTVEREAEDVIVPSLMLQPIVENSIKHALGRSLESTHIILDARVIDGRLRISIADNGPGIGDHDAGEIRSLGVGLRNVLQRLASTYGDDFTFDIQSVDPETMATKSGVRVEITVPALTSTP